jgi:hypothetical protein
MSRFSIRYPYLIIVVCLILCVVGVTSMVKMPVDLFPPIKIPVVVVATFFSGMPPEQIEFDITGRFERFFTLGSGIEHIESRCARSEPNQNLFSTRYRRRRRCYDHFKPRDGKSAASAARDMTPRGAEIRRLEFAGLLNYA